MPPITRFAEAIVCTDWAHINLDETGAPERVIGAKLIDLPAPDGKLRPDQIEHQAHLLGVQHHAQPGVVSITQSTELGTVYTVDEVAAICDAAHRLGMRVHMDGARIASAGMLAAGALLPPGKVVPPAEIWAGRPARCLRDLTPAQLEQMGLQTAKYLALAQSHRAARTNT